MTDEATLKAALVEALASLSVLHAGTLGNHWRWTARDLATALAPLLARRLAEKVPGSGFLVPGFQPETRDQRPETTEVTP